MTPGLACDSESPMAERLGPLVWPRFPVQYLADSRAWPSPLWAYNTFSPILFLSFGLRSLLFHSIPFYSISFHDASDFVYFCSILFYSLRLVSLRFYVLLVISESRCI